MVAFGDVRVVECAIGAADTPVFPAWRGLGAWGPPLTSKSPPVGPAQRVTEWETYVAGPLGCELRRNDPLSHSRFNDAADSGRLSAALIAARSLQRSGQGGA
jgi:hypothetical protein